MNKQTSILLYGIILLGYIVLLIFIPNLFPPDPGLPNVAAQLGYNTNTAYLCIALWSVTSFLMIAFAAWNGWLADKPDNTVLTTFKSGTHNTPTRLLIESIVVGLIIALLYWPHFLTRYGFYIEDKYFVNVLARMQCGELPYRDFEFLYGPLMIYPAHAWMNIMGFSLSSYYALIALLQGSFFAILYRLFAHHIPETRYRYFAFLIFIPFVFDSLLGFNYSGWRIMFLLAAILLVAARPNNKMTALLAGSLCSLQLAYSYEFGIVACITILILYALTYFDRVNRHGVIPSAIIFITLSIIMAAGLIKLFTGDTFSEYISSTLYTMKYAQESGLGNFAFYWTLNSLALFSLLSIAIVLVGIVGIKFFRQSLNYGDRLIIAALLFALGTLKIAIQRADVWHITLPFIPLLLVLLWRVPANLIRVNQATRILILGFVVIASLTRTIGILPTTSYFISGLLHGGYDVLTGKHTGAEFNSRTFSIQHNVSNTGREYIELAEFLALPVNKDDPVIFYGNAWSLGAQVGVCPSGYSFFQLMYTDKIMPMQELIQKHPSTLVVMNKLVYENLFTGTILPEKGRQLSVTKQIASWLSSIHYEQKQPERIIKQQIWQKNLGDYLVKNYHVYKSFNRYVILQRNNDMQSIRSESK